MSGIARIAEAFATARARFGGALMPYACVGDPDLATSDAIVDAMTACGADLIELAVPYGDPLADGPTVAAAAQRALDGGTTVDDALDAARRARERGAPPIVMFSYVNPIVQFGVERFARACEGAGVCGAIVPDVPLEESLELREVFEAYGLAVPLLIAPTTPLERARRIAETSTGFVYLVSRLGVTGAGKEPDFAWIAARVAALRETSSIPIAVGFGISRADHVRRVLEIADGAIVASAMIDAYAGSRGEFAVAKVRTFLGDISAGRVTAIR